MLRGCVIIQGITRKVNVFIYFRFTFLFFTYIHRLRFQERFSSGKSQRTVTFPQ